MISYLNTEKYRWHHKANIRDYKIIETVNNGLISRHGYDEISPQRWKDKQLLHTKELNLKKKKNVIRMGIMKMII